MIATGKEFPAFSDYYAPLKALEEAFQSCKAKIQFRLVLSESGLHWIEINYGWKPPQMISIEGDSPAMAIKDVAAAVRL